MTIEDFLKEANELYDKVIQNQITVGVANSQIIKSWDSITGKKPSSEPILLYHNKSIDWEESGSSYDSY